MDHVISTDRSTHVEPQIVLIDTLLGQVDRGEVRIPRFQRPFVWRPDQMLELFDSIERGYPIGSLLLWQTEEDVPTLDRIGDLAVPTGESRRPVYYVLDGHQRISTLFGVLRRDRAAPRSGDPRDWKCWIYRDLRRGDEDDRYRHHRAQDPAPEHYLPLRAVSRTMDFLEFSRNLEVRRLHRDRLEAMIRRAEIVANKIKNYQLTLIRLVGGTLSEAVEVYTRLNRNGLRMDPDQMVSALTYRGTQRPPLASRIDEIVANVATKAGFGVVPRAAVFRAVLAVAGEQDIMSPKWGAVAGRLVGRLQDAVPHTERALQAAVDFLINDVGLPLARFLPYAHQLTLLTVFFHHCPRPTEEQRRTLARWFWVTSWTNRFAGANSTTMRHAVREMKDFATGGGTLELDTTGLRPIPDTFNLNSARTRAYLTWELRELPQRRDAAGNPFDVVRLLASADSRAFRPVVDGDQHPANRVVLPTPPGMSARTALTEIWAEDRRAVLDSHGIPRTAWDRLCEGDGAGFIRDRAAHLEGRLRQFTERIGAPPAGDLVGGGDDDTE